MFIDFITKLSFQGIHTYMFCCSIAPKVVKMKPPVLLNIQWVLQ